MSVAIHRPSGRGWRWAGAAAALVGVCLVGLVYLGWERPSAAPEVSSSAGAAWWDGAPTGLTGLGAEGAGPGLRTGLEALPGSLAGTEVDGQARADAQGQLVLDRRLRDLFDYFLSLVGEEPLAQIQARVAAYLGMHLPAAARDQALDLFRRYVAYGEARGRLGAEAGGSSSAMEADALAARLGQLEALQQQHFSAAERAAFFGADNAEDRYTVARLAVWQDAHLSAADKARQLQALKEALPADLRARLTAADAVADLRAVTEAWARDGGAPEVLREARLRLVGESATTRLEALDAQRAQWRERVTAYLAQRQAVEADASLSVTQRTAALAQLRQQGFTPQEQLRLDAAMQAASPR